MYLDDVYTIPANLAGIAGAVGAVRALATGLPVGLQLIGPAFGEETASCAWPTRSRSAIGFASRARPGPSV